MLSSRFEDPQIEESKSYFPDVINGWSMAWAETNGELLWYAKRGREYRDGIIEEGTYAYLPDEIEDIVAYHLVERPTVRELMILADKAEHMHWLMSRTGLHYRPVAEVTRQVNAEVAP